MITFLRGPNFSGRSAWLNEKVQKGGWPEVGLSNHSGESLLTGLALTVREEMSISAPDQGHREEALIIDQLLDLESLYDQPLHVLSGGETVRVAIASALRQGIHELLVDTALEHLDFKWRSAILDLFRGRATQTSTYITDNRLASDEVREHDCFLEFAAPATGQEWHLNPEAFKGFSGYASDITLDELSFRYRRRSRMIFDNVDLTIPAGSINLILGANGSGKTTFLRLLCGTLVPNRGTVRFGSERFNPQKPRRFVSLAFQNPDFQFTGGTIKDELAAALSSAPIGWEADERQTLELGGIPPSQLCLSPFECGFTVKKRLANLTAILSKRPIATFDEPTIGQDSRYVSSFCKILQSLARSGRTILLISHDPRLIENLRGAETLMVENGKMLRVSI